MTEHVWYGTFFDNLRCEDLTRKREQCRMTPAYRYRDTGLLLCFIHAEKRFRELKEERERTAVPAGD